MRWLRRMLLLGMVSTIVALLLRRRQALPVAAPEWPPLVPPTLATPAPTDTNAADANTGEAPPWVAPMEVACPEGFPIKVARSGIAHEPDGRSYERTTPVRCYARIEDAEADGYRRAKL
jgi:hypothetical protein